MAAGAKEVYIGDLNAQEDAAKATEGIDTVNFICNTANPREDEIGARLIETAKKIGGITFIYHSADCVHADADPCHSVRQTWRTVCPEILYL